MRKTVILLVLFAAAASAFAQGLQLTPEQQQMLNALPAAQRQQALQAIRDLQGRQSASVQQTINEPIAEAASPLDESALTTLSTDEEPRAEARSRLVLGFSIREDLGPDETEALGADPALSRLVGSHVFILDDSGVLSLDGLEFIPLLGLGETDIRSRLQAEPGLSSFDIDVRILDQKAIGTEALQPFGYDVFEQGGGLEAPTAGPVPSDYVLGPGDSVRVQLFGNVNAIYESEVSRDGILNLPEIGPVTVAGITFSEFRRDLEERVREMLIGTQVSATMGPLRTIRVFVLGDVNRPGSYVVSGLATISTALYRSGGISDVGTLRNVQLKRAGKIVSRFDVYSLLIRGDTSGDRRLQPGDVVFVPPIGNTVAVGGAVKRPAIYESKGEATIADAVELAGGLAPDAFAEGAILERIDGKRTTIAIDLTRDESSRLRVRAGDTLTVPQVLPSFENTVVLAGHVFRPGKYEWRPGMRLTDLIQTPEVLKPGVDTGYVLIRRERERGQPIEVLSANLGAALQAPNGSDDIRLVAADTVYVFGLELGRQRVIERLLRELGLQSTVDAPLGKVQISGNVRAPGTYPLGEGMRVSDLIRASGDLSEAAYTLEAELTRYSARDASRETEVLVVDLEAIRRGDESADVLLREHDYLIINRLPDWDSTWSVTVDGEVRFPGQYRVRRGETLGEVIDRAGGFSENAFVEGAVFLRESLKQQEQEQIETLARRMEADLATLSVQTAATGGSETLSTGRVLLDQLRRTEAVGRLVIHLKPDRNDVSGSSETVEMRDGDKLFVPTRSQVVSVLGETQQNSSHLFREGLTRDEYIDLSGGLTRRADKKLIYVVRANGAVVAGNRSKWFGRRSNVDIRPGDTIVVPLDTDRMRPLTFWGNVTQILYQAAIAVAAVQTFDN
ncbi:MAG: SLBB domain-containing protein [Woeseiaceae bacterium]|nr:SLBB domain-containing protein [Woeseiaceae bacterium]